MKSIVSFAAIMVALCGPAFAGDIGGGIAVFNASSFSGGAIAGGNLGGAVVAGPGGAINSSFTQSAHNDGLAGTIVKLEKLPGGFTSSIVSEHQLNGWTNQTIVGSTQGFAGQANLSAGIQAGAALSGGQMTGVSGYLNW